MDEEWKDKVVKVSKFVKKKNKKVEECDVLIHRFGFFML